MLYRVQTIYNEAKHTVKLCWFHLIIGFRLKVRYHQPNYEVSFTCPTTYISMHFLTLLPLIIENHTVFIMIMIMNNNNLIKF